MKIFRINILFFILLFACAFSFGQSLTISGTVLDGHTKEPVSYASVYFTKSGYGKITDTAGHFSFVINNFKDDTLQVSFIGFALYSLPINGLQNNKTLNIQLERGSAKGEVVVKAKWNRGLYLWKKIMSKKKQYNRYDLGNFSYEAYNKLEIDIKNFNADKAKKNFLLKNFSFIFDNIDSTSESTPFLPAYLIETLSDYAYQNNPKKFNEHVKASKTVGFKNESFAKLLGVMNQNVSIYSNYVNVMDKDFISPFHDNADAYYIFTVPDTQLVNGTKLYHFVFRPKRPGQNTFEGDAWVKEQSYQITKISMYLGKDANINFIDRISVFQEYIPINDSTIFLNRDKFFADFRVMGKKSLTLIGRKTTSYKDININSDSLTAAFKDQRIEELVTSGKNVIQNADSVWKDLRHDSLSKNEKTIYATIDKLIEMPKFQKFQRNLRFLATGYKDFGKIELGPWFNWISADTVQGTRFRFDVGTNSKLMKNVYLHGYLAYGLRDKRFKGQAEAYWIVNREPKRIRLHLSYQNDVDNGINQVGEVSQDNVFSLAIRKPNNNRKFINVRDLRFEVFNDLGKGFSSEWFVSHRHYTPLLNLPPDSNFAVTSGTKLTNFEIALKLRFAYLERFIETDYNRYSLGTKYPIVELLVAKGFAGVFNSAYNYTKLSLTVKDNLRISPYGIISYKVFGGKIFGTMPFTNLENHQGNDIFYYSQSAYNLMNRFEYLSDQYAGANVEHNFGSGIFRFIPFTRKMKWRQFWNVKALWGSLSDENYALNYIVDADTRAKIPAFKRLNDQTYIEVGTGIDNIFKVFRLDFVWRVSPSSTFAGKQNQFGIFGSFRIQF
ncbi:MAG: carboxypeptidase-like regulatory domain-containing protein [Chitinophagaceae bacterium]|nr:carboxypeptidase-like regulatory domain-containing protein [Chitinophagaceae bacterium]